jgi:peptidoglycan/LPS O-acetylase OafA/YrhL
MSAAWTIPHRPDIQGLRAVAVAIVVLAHASVPGFAGGFVGVDVFFVLSGFLITGLLVKERQATGMIRYGRFLSRRLRRLLPALLVMLVIVFVLATSFLSAYEAQMQTGALPFAATWSSNFYFAYAEFDYFAALKSKDFFLHTWSLGIEEQFYLVWPWLVTGAFALAASSPGPNRETRSLLWIIALVFVLSIVLSLVWAQSRPLQSFYMMPARGWQFALGATVFAAGARGWTGSTAARQTAGVLGLVLIIGSAMLLHPRLNYPGYYALLPSLGAALLIHAGAGTDATVLSRLLAARGFVWLGDRSYSLYLWHWPALLFAAAFGLTEQAAGIAAVIVIATLLAAASYRCIELPFWKGRYSGAAPRSIALTSMLSMLVVIWLSLLPDEVNFKDGIGRDSFVAGFDCDSWYHSAAVLPCRSGDPNAAHTVVLFGDSIGTQWAPLFPEIFRAPDWQVLVLAKSACAIADLEYYYKPVGGLYDVCTEWRNNSIEYLKEIRPDIVFIGTAASNPFTESEWVGGTERVIAMLAAATPHIVVIAGTPALSFHGPSCLKEPYRFTSRLRDSQYLCEETMASTRSDAVAAYLEQAIRSNGNAHLLNMNDLVCPEQRCAARNRSGITVFRDSDHLTASFVLAQAQAMRARLGAMRLAPPLPEDRASRK